MARSRLRAVVKAWMEVVGETTATRCRRQNRRRGQFKDDAAMSSPCMMTAHSGEVLEVRQLLSTIELVEFPMN